MHPTVPPPLAPPASSENRVKQTFACEACRRRKAKCSGISPCPPCRKNGLDCVFVYQRQRRGRKAKRTAIDTAMDTIMDTTMDTTMDTATLDLSSSNEVPRPASSSTTSESGPSPCLPRLHQALLDDLNSRAGNGTEHGTRPDTSMLATLVLHLLDLFFDHVAAQFPLFIRRSQLQQCLHEDDGPIYLCYALSLPSLQWSAHRSIRDASARSRVEQLLLMYVRDSQQNCLGMDQLLPCLQSYCALIVHDISGGHGLKAWADLGAATSMADLLRLQEDIPDAAEEPMQLVTSFLSTFKLLSTVGHPKLARLCSRDSGTVLHQTRDTGTTPDALNLSSVCALLAQIHAEAESGFVDSTPPPWSSKSAFISLRQSLDQVRLSWTGCLFSHTQCPSEPHAEASDSAHEWLTVIIWHTCVIVLNNVFLPIPVHSPEHTLSFPRAPQQFLRERIQACEASAAQIARICRRIMSQDAPFPSPLLGYSCIQSALVFLNQMQRSRPAIQPETLLNLKIVLTMLGAIRNFYMPASLWIRTFMEIHSGLYEPDEAINATTTAPDEYDASTLFKNFTARYPGVETIAFIPFASKEQLESTANKALAPIVRIGPPTVIGLVNNSRHDWMIAYDKHLDNDLAPEPVGHLQCTVDDIAANYESSLEQMSGWYPGDDFPLIQDGRFPNDITLQGLVDEIENTIGLSDTFLSDILNQDMALVTL